MIIGTLVSLFQQLQCVIQVMYTAPYSLLQPLLQLYLHSPAVMIAVLDATLPGDRRCCCIQHFVFQQLT